jgi:predicted ribonuclease YlaK
MGRGRQEPEQNFAMNLLMDPEVDFVTLTALRAPAKP